MILLIQILQDSSRPLSIIASCQQDLQLIPILFFTDSDFSVEQISNIIKKLDPNKAHGHAKISKRMLKLCGDSINRPLATIFKNCFNERIFPNDWKKANGVAIHKKNDKQIVTNYRLASLLPVCSKIFE